MKAVTSRITSAAGGALCSMRLLMPVSCWMKGGTWAPLRIRLANRPTMRPSRTSTAAISVARAPNAGLMPVVSKSMTAMVWGLLTAALSAAPGDGAGLPVAHPAAHRATPRTALIERLGMWPDSPMVRRPGRRIQPPNSRAAALAVGRHWRPGRRAGA